jgi:hypothetical protein
MVDRNNHINSERPIDPYHSDVTLTSDDKYAMTYSYERGFFTVWDVATHKQVNDDVAIKESTLRKIQTAAEKLERLSNTPETESLRPILQTMREKLSTFQRLDAEKNIVRVSATSAKHDSR